MPKPKQGAECRRSQLAGRPHQCACHICVPTRGTKTRHVLVESARQLGRKGHEGIELDLTNEQLAVAARMTVFTATRKLRKWRGLGILTKRRGKIVLPSLSGFESACKCGNT